MKIHFKYNFELKFTREIAKIKNYPGFEEVSGPDLSNHLFNQVKALEIPYKMEEVISVKITEDEKDIFSDYCSPDPNGYLGL